MIKSFIDFLNNDITIKSYIIITISAICTLFIILIIAKLFFRTIKKEDVSEKQGEQDLK